MDYTDLPEHTAAALTSFGPPKEAVAERVAYFRDTPRREPDRDGATEVLDGAVFTHHLVDAPGDYGMVRWHYVECGPSDGEVVLFLHGLPDSWYQWHHQMAALSSTHRCVAVDLKGYGQSEKRPGDYRHEGAAEQLIAMARAIGVDRFNLVAHDRGAVQGDFIAANHPRSVMRYGRGEQHLHHFNPALAPQEAMFRDAPWTGLMEDVEHFVVMVYTWLTERPLPDDEMRRVIQEFSYPGVVRAIPRYFNSSTFEQEWHARRERLLPSITCPVLIMQGRNSVNQPWEFYENSREYLPNSPDVQVRYMPGGHFWTMERPEETTDAVRHLLSM